MFIFHKTEVQTVILKCLTSLNTNWFKSYDTKCKNAYDRKKRELEMSAFWGMTFEPIKIQTCSAPQNDRLIFSFVKDIKVGVEKMTRNCRKMIE